MRRCVLAPLAFFYLVLASGTMAAPAATVPDAQILRARMAAASGPPNVNYRETIVGSGAGGRTVTVRFHRGDDEYVTFARGPIRTSYGTNHGADWHQTANGIVVPDARDPGFVPSLKTTTRVQRVRAPLDAYVISELDGSGYGQRDFVDPRSYLLLRHDEIGPAGTASTTYANYARFGMQMLPSSWRVVDNSFDESTAYVRTQFATGSTRAADVAKPPLRRLVTLPPGATTVDLHARFQQGRIVVPVALAGRTFYFLLDSGASAITIDANVAKALGLALVNESHEIAGKRYVMHDTIIPALDIGGLQMRNVAASALSLEMGTKPSDPAGLLGFDFLAGLAVRIDYEHKRVLAMDTRSYVPPSGKDVSALDVRLGAQVPMISAKLAGADAERLIVDTGSGGSLLLFDYFARRHGDVLHSRLNSAVGPDASSGIGGEFTSRPYRLSNVRIGHFSISGLTADVVTSTGAYPQDNDGLIGSDILQFFTVDFDYAAGRIFLRARPQLITESL